MTKLERVRELLKKALLSFERISTDKALIESDDDEIVVGSSVFGIDEEGNRFDLENGEYRADDGTVYVVEDGKVVEIREPDNSDTTGDDVQPESEGDQVPSGVTAETQEPEQEPEEDMDERIGNLEAEISRLEQRIGELEEENNQLRDQIKELENKPAAEPAETDFENVTKVDDTGDKKLNNLIRRFSK